MYIALVLFPLLRQLRTPYGRASSGTAVRIDKGMAA